MNVLASTGLAPTLGESKSLGLDEALEFNLVRPAVRVLYLLVSGVILELAAEFMSVTAASKIL